MRRWLAGFVFTVISVVSAFADPQNTSIVADGLGFPEGTILVNGTLFFVDYQASTVNRLVGNSYTVVTHLPGCGANGLVASNNNIWVACYDNGTVENISMEGDHLSVISRSRSGDLFNRPNDLVADHEGNIYFTASGDRPGAGKVFLLSSSSDAPQEVASGIDNANGVALSPDEKILYVGESGADRILSYQISKQGMLHDPRVFVQLDSLAPSSSVGRHTPDGIRTEPDGMLYVALFNGGGYWVLDKNGKLLKIIDVPGEHHSNLAVSSAERIVYVTSISSSRGRIYELPLPPEAKGFR
jgi:gluconolactonase